MMHAEFYKNAYIMRITTDLQSLPQLLIHLYILLTIAANDNNSHSTRISYCTFLIYNNLGGWEGIEQI